MRKSPTLPIAAMVTIALADDDNYDDEEEAALHSINELLQKRQSPLLENEPSTDAELVDSADGDSSESSIEQFDNKGCTAPSSPALVSRHHKNPTPILKTRIPRELQAVFLAGQRGDEVHAPKSGVAFQVFERKKFASAPFSHTTGRKESERKKSARLWFGSNETVVFDKKLPPSVKLVPAQPRPSLCRWSSCPSGLSVVGQPLSLPERSPVTDNRPMLPTRVTSPSSSQKPKLRRLPSCCHPEDETIPVSD
jgi:hypothetical protein